MHQKTKKNPLVFIQFLLPSFERVMIDIDKRFNINSHKFFVTNSPIFLEKKLLQCALIPNFMESAEAGGLFL